MKRAEKISPDSRRLLTRRRNKRLKTPLRELPREMLQMVRKELTISLAMMRKKTTSYFEHIYL
jgi:hypothetical protein